MKHTSSYTDSNGITTTLSVSAELADLERLLEASLHEAEVSYLPETFERCLLGMPAVHLQAHHEVCENLRVSSIEALKENIDLMQADLGDRLHTNPENKEQ